MGQRHTIGNGKLGAKMRYHAANMMVLIAEMETPFTALTVTILVSLPLFEQFMQGAFYGW